MEAATSVAPAAMVGVPAMIEVESGNDYRDITPVQARVAETEPKPAAAKKPAAKPKADAKPTPAAEDVQEAEVVEEEVVEDATEDEAPQPATETENTPDPSQFDALYDMIRGDLMQCGAGDVDEVINLYGDQVSQMEAAAPELHKKLMAEVAAIKAPAG